MLCVSDCQRLVSFLTFQNLTPTKLKSNGRFIVTDFYLLLHRGWYVRSYIFSCGQTRQYYNLLQQYLSPSNCIFSLIHWNGGGMLLLILWFQEMEYLVVELESLECVYSRNGRLTITSSFSNFQFNQFTSHGKNFTLKFIIVRY